MMNTPRKLMLVISLVALLPIMGSMSLVTAEKCEDITGVEKWDGEGHDDNSPSEKKGEKMVFEENATPCEITEAIDHMEIDFDVTGKKEWKIFKTTFAWEATSEEAQECIEKRYKLPNDDGKPELASYEYKNCMLGSY